MYRRSRELQDCDHGDRRRSRDDPADAILRPAGESLEPLAAAAARLDEHGGPRFAEQQGHYPAQGRRRGRHRRRGSRGPVRDPRRHPGSGLAGGAD